MLEKTKAFLTNQKNFSQMPEYVEILSVIFSIISYKIVFISVISMNLDLYNSAKVKNVFEQCYCK